MSDGVTEEEIVQGEVVEATIDDDVAAEDSSLEELADELSDVKTVAEERLDDLQRLAADFENFRKRAAREQAETVERAGQRIIEALLPVLDSFDGAFAHEAQTPGEELLKKGITSTFHQLMEILEREGLAVIESVGEPFDPTVHEAVTGGIGDDLVVADEMRRGYTLKGRVLRPAMVSVAPADGEEAPAE